MMVKITDEYKDTSDYWEEKEYKDSNQEEKYDDSSAYNDEDEDEEYWEDKLDTDENLTKLPENLIPTEYYILANRAKKLGQIQEDTSLNLDTETKTILDVLKYLRSNESEIKISLYETLDDQEVLKRVLFIELDFIYEFIKNSTSTSKTQENMDFLRILVNKYHTLLGEKGDIICGKVWLLYEDFMPLNQDKENEEDADYIFPEDNIIEDTDINKKEYTKVSDILKVIVPRVFKIGDPNKIKKFKLNEDIKRDIRRYGRENSISIPNTIHTSALSPVLKEIFPRLYKDKSLKKMMQENGKTTGFTGYSLISIYDKQEDLQEKDIEKSNSSDEKLELLGSSNRYSWRAYESINSTISPLSERYLSNEEQEFVENLKELFKSGNDDNPHYYDVRFVSNFIEFYYEKNGLETNNSQTNTKRIGFYITIAFYHSSMKHFKANGYINGRHDVVGYNIRLTNKGIHLYNGFTNQSPNN